MFTLCACNRTWGPASKTSPSFGVSFQLVSYNLYIVGADLAPTWPWVNTRNVARTGWNGNALRIWNATARRTDVPGHVGLIPRTKKDNWTISGPGWVHRIYIGIGVDRGLLRFRSSQVNNGFVNHIWIGWGVWRCFLWKPNIDLFQFWSL